jgi:hypothetical protein
MIPSVPQVSVGSQAVCGAMNPMESRERTVQCEKNREMSTYSQNSKACFRSPRAAVLESTAFRIVTLQKICKCCDEY